MAAGDGQSGAEIVPERDFELGAGLGQTEEGVSTVTTGIAARAAADLSPGDVAADVVLRSVALAVLSAAPRSSTAPIGASSARTISPSARAAASRWRAVRQRGGRKTPQRQAYERSPAFKQGQRFRAGIEGRISVLMRGRGMKHCRAEGAERFALFVGAAVLANNLIIIGELLTKRSRRRRNTDRQFLS
jgi:hypothetical protein